MPNQPRIFLMQIKLGIKAGPNENKCPVDGGPEQVKPAQARLTRRCGFCVGSRHSSALDDGIPLYKAGPLQRALGPPPAST
jgi:hypothetical protein